MLNRWLGVRAVFAGAAIALVMQMILNMFELGVRLSSLDVAQGETPASAQCQLVLVSGLSFREYWRLTSEFREMSRRPS